MRIQTLLLALFALALSCVLFRGAAQAQGGPFAIRFSGYVHIGGQPAPAGLRIAALTARSASDTFDCGDGVTTDGGGYTITIAPQQRCSDEGGGGSTSFIFTYDGEQIGSYGTHLSLSGRTQLGQTITTSLSMPAIPGRQPSAAPLVVARFYGVFHMQNQVAPAGISLTLVTLRNGDAFTCGAGTTTDGGNYVIDVSAEPRCSDAGNGGQTPFVFLYNGEAVGKYPTHIDLSTPVSLGRATSIYLNSAAAPPLTGGVSNDPPAPALPNGIPLNPPPTTASSPGSPQTLGPQQVSGYGYQYTVPDGWTSSVTSPAGIDAIGGTPDGGQVAYVVANYTPAQTDTNDPFSPPAAVSALQAALNQLAQSAPVQIQTAPTPKTVPYASSAAYASFSYSGTAEPLKAQYAGTATPLTLAPGSTPRRVFLLTALVPYQTADGQTFTYQYTQVIDVTADYAAANYELLARIEDSFLPQPPQDFTPLIDPATGAGSA